MRAAAHVNLAAIERNVTRMASELRDGAQLCAVVKANAYGHGASAVARAALSAGASRLAVASSGEAAQLRSAGIVDVPLLVLGALSEREREEALAAGAEVCVWHEREVAAVAAAGGGGVHVKLDTGMGRLGTRDPEEAMRVLEAAERTCGVELVGVMTHFATADEMGDGGFFDAQLGAFARWVQRAKEGRPGLIAHAANSAATLRDQASHFDMVRCGVSIYGLDPFGSDPLAVGLEPALELRSRVAEVKRCRAGQSAGYGRRFVARADTWIAVLPIGYGDGWRRGLSDNGETLVAGRRLPLVGTISMDNVTVDLGPRAGGGGEPAAGEEAILIGASGRERITAEQVAARLGTINYEVTTSIACRVPRLHHFDGRPVSAAGAGEGAEPVAARGALPPQGGACGGEGRGAGGRGAG